MILWQAWASAVSKPDLQRSTWREMSFAILREQEENILICERMKVGVQSRKQEMKAAAVRAPRLRCCGFNSLEKICHVKKETAACVVLSALWSCGREFQSHTTDLILTISIRTATLFLYCYNNVITSSVTLESLSGPTYRKVCSENNRKGLWKSSQREQKKTKWESISFIPGIHWQNTQKV